MFEFYLVDVEFVGIDGKVKVEKDVLHFRHEQAGFDNRATPEHVKLHSHAFSKFAEKHPGFKLPWEPKEELALKVGEVAKVEAPKEEEKSEEPAKELDAPAAPKGSKAPKAKKASK